jgi:uncharacterized protein (TIGR03790 family)
MNLIRASWLLLWGMLLVFVLPGSVMGLESSEILIVANRQSAEGVELARYYARMRDIPEANLLWLNLSTAETCSRDVYEQSIAAPVRDFLAAIQPSWRIRCLVLIYGLPLKVRPAVTVDEKDGGEFKARQEMLQQLIEHKDTAESPSALGEELETVRSQLNQLKITRDQVASVDSELTVVKAPDAPIGGWIENPFYIGFRDRDEAIPRENVLMVSRLDGPTADSVKRIIDDTLSAEKNGLRGTAYFDARWPISPSPEPSGYQRYDNSIHRAAQQVEKSGRLPVRIDETPTLFQPGQCPDAALYCGWYSLANYVDAFQWHQGAIGYHIASGECTTLKKKNSQGWCKRMIEDGICATIGPVAEPYVQAFPMPEVFFGFLTEGILSLAECYMVSLPYLSWKMVLIGDPLYHPF